ncbi:helix-turn-helix domain-containing protein [Weissella minor]|uniref:helix-turn-helix domain-containing protein n=1 Tax=Weissella minor TaxID=1620 RepID=UPI001BAF043B|nr:helix-turn-helix domain-containing protein [Weissella minor]MBS0950512.1 helix-turn-helix domain-containing protein [Weissella minor]
MKAEFLLTLFSKQQPRRSHVIYALLKQQTTGSTEYWGLRYHLLDWIGLLPQLYKQDYENMLQDLMSERCLRQSEKGLYILTDKGELVAKCYAEEHYLLQLPLERYTYQTAPFMQLFLLANQVVSEWSYQNRHYYPMQIGLRQQQLIKQWFKRQDRESLLDAWKSDLTGFLESLSDKQADRLAASFVGHTHAGLNFDQLNFPKTWGDFDFYLWQLDKYTELIQYMETHFSKDNPMVQLYAFVGKKPRLSDSVQASFMAAKQGASFQDIAQQRHLKLGTVQEHLLTAAIWLPLSAFPYERYLTDDVKKHLTEHLPDQDIDNWRFKMVRESSDIQEFFNFRLYQIWLTKQETSDE